MLVIDLALRDKPKELDRMLSGMPVVSNAFANNSQGVLRTSNYPCPQCMDPPSIRQSFQPRNDRPVNHRDQPASLASPSD